MGGNLTQLTDNMVYGQRKALSEFKYSGLEGKEKADFIYNRLKWYAGRTINDLRKACPGLMIFPPVVSMYDDDLEKTCLFDIVCSRKDSDYLIETGNLMGAFGIGDIHISIGSRFDTDENKPYFMRYILHKVLGMHVVNLPTHDSADPIVELCIFLFPMALRQALVKGLFKAYRRFEYNDANIKGAIDISRHLRTNIPFRGRVAYVTREHTVDNPLLQLVRHTIEFIKSGPYREILSAADGDVWEAVAQIVAATPTYMRQQRVKVMGQNLRPVRHPYYSEYSLLQKISLQILRHEKISHGSGQDDLAGIVFDGAWLWEEYLNKVMEADAVIKKGGLRHPRNKQRLDPIHIYKAREAEGSDRKPIYPDFLWSAVDDKKQHWNLVLDAKYKRAFYVGDDGKEHFGVQREDRYQMISYLHLTQAKQGIFVCPMTENDLKDVNGEQNVEEKLEADKDGSCYVEGELLGHGGTISVLPFTVPKSGEHDFGSFSAKMKEAEESFCGLVKEHVQVRPTETICAL